MKSKEEIIEEAYGKYWEGFPEKLRKFAYENDGYIHSDKVMFEGIELPKDKNLFDIEWRHCSAYGWQVIRPISLRGIEDNNGWTLVNNRNDMPKHNCLVKICLGGIPDRAIYEWDSESGLMCAIDGLNISPGSYKYRFYSANTSHYKIVELDKPPIY